jgi:hypothetical protein
MRERTIPTLPASFTAQVFIDDRDVHRGDCGCDLIALLGLARSRAAVNSR